MSSTSAVPAATPTPLLTADTTVLQDMLKCQHAYERALYTKRQGSLYVKLCYCLRHRTLLTEAHLQRLEQTYAVALDTLLLSATSSTAAEQKTLTAWLKLHRIAPCKLWQRRLKAQLTVIEFTRHLQHSVRAAQEPYTTKALPWQQPHLGTHPTSPLIELHAALQLAEHLADDFDAMLSAGQQTGPALLPARALVEWQAVQSAITAAINVVRSHAAAATTPAHLQQTLTDNLRRWQQLLTAAAGHPAFAATLSALDQLLELTEPSVTAMPWLRRLWRGGLCLEKLASQGASATVYKATHIKRPDEMYLIKAFHMPIDYTLWTKTNYGEHTATLAGPFTRIVGILTSPKGVEAAVMTFIAGAEELKTALPRLTLAQKKAVFAALLSAVELLHNANYIHRDLKPANILLDQHHKVWIVDPGFQVKLTAAEPFCTHHCGTPRYIAPEVLCRLPHSQPADIYSLGVIAYELFSTHSPITEFIQPDEISHDWLRLGPLIRCDLDTLEDPQLYSMVAAMLAEDPSQRPTIQKAQALFNNLI